MVAAARVLAGLAALLPALPCAAGADAPCAAEVVLRPARAYVGQQVVYEIRILQREDVREVRWDLPPAFPALRADRLPSRSDDTAVTLGGARYRRVRERRALFASRAGTHPIPPTRLRCETPAGAPGHAGPVVVPGTRLEVRPLPDAGRPADFTGVVGRVELRAELSPRALALGGSSRLSVSATGAANVWQVASPAGTLAEIDGLEVLARPPALSERAGERLGLRQTHAFDLIPHREGRFEIRLPSVAYFDPETARYGRARAERLLLTVGPRAAGSEAAPAPDAGAPGRLAPPGGRLPRWPLALAAAALVTALGLRRWRRAGRVRRREIRAWLSEAEAALASGDASRACALLARALRRAAAAAVPGAAGLTAEELLGRDALLPATREALDLLAAIDRARFAGADPRLLPSDPVGRARHAVERLRRAGSAAGSPRSA